VHAYRATIYCNWHNTVESGLKKQPCMCWTSRSLLRTCLPFSNILRCSTAGAVLVWCGVVLDSSCCWPEQGPLHMSSCSAWLGRKFPPSTSCCQQCGRVIADSLWTANSSSMAIVVVGGHFVSCTLSGCCCRWIYASQNEAWFGQLLLLLACPFIPVQSLIHCFDNQTALQTTSALNT